ncbi:DoxX family protein [Ferruginibacter sp. SUN002]|uniref:DoxX family protein n=1 Tax=Ferruginibacter sp. SUN002 TaxID=2937789 RepID=UPI003D3604DB
MKKDRIIYWSATGIIGLMMLFSAYNYFSNPQMAGAFKHLGFPDYFRIELAIAKILGVAILLIPQVSNKIKEWAYAGFGIVFISASIAHASSGDPSSAIITPMIFLAILAVSNFYLYKLSKIQKVAKVAVRSTKQTSTPSITKPEFSLS